jgi:[1-hydroxy-2-(trimethylamino)ethyl]phosphonate dioxygenase
MNHDPIAVIVALIEGRGEGRYGLSAVNQRAHALQAALLAERSGCDSALVAAALVHDLGDILRPTAWTTGTNRSVTISWSVVSGPS